jgi:hypothetical protein
MTKVVALGMGRKATVSVRTGTTEPTETTEITTATAIRSEWRW